MILKKLIEKKMHPQLYQLFDEVDEKGFECNRFYREEIAPCKKQIDEILQDWNYYPAEVKKVKEQELEKWRNRLHLANTTMKNLENEKEVVCDKIKKYVEDNNLEWAKQMGWHY